MLSVYFTMLHLHIKANSLEKWHNRLSSLDVWYSIWWQLLLRRYGELFSCREWRMETKLAVATVPECKTKVAVSRKLFSHEGMAEVLMFFCQANRVCGKVAAGHNSRPSDTSNHPDLYCTRTMHHNFPTSSQLAIRDGGWGVINEQTVPEELKT